MLNPSILALMLACTGDSQDTGTGGDGGGGTADGGSSTIPCVETETPLAKSTAPVTVEEVWPLIEAWSPTSILWSQASSGMEGESQPFAVTFTQSGDAVVVERTGGDVYSLTHPLACRPGPELRIPVTVEVVVDGGNATASYTGNVDAQGASYPLVFFHLRTSETDPPDLSKDWLAAANTEIDESWGQTSAEAVMESSFSRGEYDGDWLPVWAVTVEASDGGWGGVLWKGEIPAPD
jgi:hypothetical protein